MSVLEFKFAAKVVKNFDICNFFSIFVPDFGNKSAFNG